MFSNVSRSHRRPVAALAAAACLTLVASACSGSGADDGDLEIGMVQPLSGALAGYGEETQAGFEYVIDQINSNGGIESMDGAKIKIIKADDGSDPSKTATEARRLIGKEGVPLIVGVPITTEMAAISPVADQFQVPVLSMGAGGSNSDYLYSLGLPYDEGYAKSMADFLVDAKTEAGAPIETVALVYSDYETGQVVSKALSKRLEAAGIEVVGDIPLATDSDNYKPQLTKLNDLAPDVAVGMVTTENGVSLHKARAATKSEVVFVGGTGGYSDHLVWDSLGESTAKQVLTNNMFGMSNFSQWADLPSLKKFLEATSKEKFDVPVGQYFIAGAQAAFVIKEVLEEAASDDPKKIYEAFTKIHIPADAEGLLFPRPEGLQFDPETRFLTDNGSLMIRWQQDGSQKVVWPPAFATEPLSADMF